MDMKKFLQVVDNASKPVEKTSMLIEGANPHKVSLPVQMAMQHYQQPKTTVVKKDFRLRKFFEQVEQEVHEQENLRKEELKMYAQSIAERVMKKKHWK